MTRAVVVPPVTAAAILAGYTGWVGLDDATVPCETCGGSGCDITGAIGAVLWDPCDDCIDGRVPLPPGPVLLVSDGHILGTLTIGDVVPVVGRDTPGDDPTWRKRAIWSYGPPVNILELWDTEGGYPTMVADISDALPVGPWIPGGWGLHVARFEPTIVCPAESCGQVSYDLTAEDEPVRFEDCELCDSTGRLSCPVPWPSAPDTPGIHTVDLDEIGNTEGTTT